MPRRAAPIKYAPSGHPFIRTRIDGRQVYRTFDTEAEAAAWWHQIEADKSRGVEISPRDAAVTFREYAETWRAQQLWEYGTAQLVRNSLEVHLYPQIGDVPLGRLRPTQLQGVVSELAGRLSPSTLRNQTVMHLKQVLNAAVADRMIPSNPATRLRLPRHIPVEVVIPTVEEVAVIRNSIDARFRALVVVGLGLGLRQGEAFGLSVDRVDFLRREVRIDRQLKRVERGMILGKLKTQNSYRTIPLPDLVGDELALHLERFPNDDPDGLLFVAAQGGRLRSDGWNRRTWKPAVRAAGRSDLGFHSLRHFYASALIRDGQSAAAVARRLGNTAAMVNETYSHLWPDEDDRTRSTIDGLFSPDAENRAAG